MKSSGGLSRFFCRNPSQLYMTCENGYATFALLPGFSLLYQIHPLPHSLWITMVWLHGSTNFKKHHELHEVGSPLQQSAWPLFPQESHHEASLYGPEDSRVMLRSRLQRRVSLPFWVSQSVDAEFALAAILLSNWRCKGNLLWRGFGTGTQPKKCLGLRFQCEASWGLFLSFHLHDWSCRWREGWVSDTNKQIRHNIKLTKLLNHQNGQCTVEQLSIPGIFQPFCCISAKCVAQIALESLQKRISGLIVCGTNYLFQNPIVITYSALQIHFCNGWFYTPYSYVLYTLQ